MKKSYVAIAAISLIPLQTLAMEDIQIYGFASYATGQTTKEADLPGGGTSVFGADERILYTDQNSFRSETTYGLQIDADLQDGLAAKALLQADGSNEYSAEIKWTYFDYSLTKDLTISGGRQPLPLFYYTDFVDVGYSYLWVRAPLEAYYIKNSTFDGVQAVYAPTIGNWDSKIQMYHGKSSDTDALRLTDMNGLVLYTANSWLELRATAMKTNIITKDSSLNVLTGEVTDLGDVETPSIFLGAAFKVNLESGFFTAEWARDKEDKGMQEYQYLQGVEGWYASTGLIIGNVTPYVTYAESEFTASKENPFSNSQQFLRSKSWTVGSRWDFHSNAAFKIEYTDKKDVSDEFTTMILGKTYEVSVISASVDLVF